MKKFNIVFYISIYLYLPIKMANSVEISLISILLICITAAAQERKSFSNNFSALSQVNGDGICKTLVETQGYKCEEHKVNKYYY